MAKIVIDARELRTSTGRYVERLLHYLQKIKSEHKFIVLLKPEDFNKWRPESDNFSKLVCPYKEFGLAEQTGFLNQLNKLSADLVHFGMTQQPALYRGLKVTTVHDLTTARFDNPGKNPVVFRFKQKVYRQLIKKVARDSSLIFTPSKFVKNDLAQFAHISKSKILVTYESADKITTSTKPIKKLSGEKFLMYVGRPNPHKNLYRLVEAYKIVRLRNPSLKLVIAGKKDFLMQKLERSVKSHGLSDDVIFPGFVGEGELRWLYENTLAYVFPSLSEGFGLPGLEAMVHGAPVISSRATCLPEIYKKGACYFNPYDEIDMGNKINKVITDKKYRDNLIAEGFNVSAQYSWEKMAQQTLNAYDKVLKK